MGAAFRRVPARSESRLAASGSQCCPALSTLSNTHQLYALQPTLRTRLLSDLLEMAVGSVGGADAEWAER